LTVLANWPIYQYANMGNGGGLAIIHEFSYNYHPCPLPVLPATKPAHLIFLPSSSAARWGCLPPV
jgi:hypothetical protein